MAETRLVSLLGLGFGDCGKGLFTDYLCRQQQAHTVVRFNGGAQAGHNVVLPDGRHHTFSQFGAGSFVAGVATLLAYPVLVHPSALLVENAYLKRAGVADALQRLLIDRRCRITTPFHQAAGRLRELQRGAHAHGSCGVGVGETVRHALDASQEVLTYGDLFQPSTALGKLDAMRRSLLAQFAPDCAVAQHRAAYQAERQVLTDASIAARWLERIGELTAQVPPASPAMVAERLHRPGTILFEGAQGVLLDEWRGFHPHTTWSSIHPTAVEAVAADAGQTARIEHYGVLRAYMTRHGQGPLPTHDAALDCLPEPHNASDGWQGTFRRGQPDAVLLRYALAVAGALDGLLVSHLDAFDRVAGLRWCTGYAAPMLDMDETACVRDHASGLITVLRPGASRDLAHQAYLTRLLGAARPQYEERPVTTAAAHIEKLEDVTGCPVLFGSFGPSHACVEALRN